MSAIVGNEKRLLTDIEAAEVLGVSRTFVRRLVANGELKRVRLPSRIDGEDARLLRIDRADIEALIQRNKTRVT